MSTRDRYHVIFLCVDAEMGAKQNPKRTRYMLPGFVEMQSLPDLLIKLTVILNLQ